MPDSSSPEWWLALEQAARTEDWAALATVVNRAPPVALWLRMEELRYLTVSWRERVLDACGYSALEQAFEDQVYQVDMHRKPVNPEAVSWAQTQAPLVTPLAATVLLYRHLAIATDVMGTQAPVIFPFLNRLDSANRATFMMLPHLHPSKDSQPAFEQVLHSLDVNDQHRWMPVLLVQAVALGDEDQLKWAQRIAISMDHELTGKDWGDALFATIIYDKDTLGTHLAQQHPDAVVPLIQRLAQNDDVDVELADHFMFHQLPLAQLDHTWLALEQQGMAVDSNFPLTRQKRLAIQRTHGLQQTGAPDRPQRTRRPRS